MGLKKGLGSNDDIDSSGNIEDVSYVPVEQTTDIAEEKSDEQRLTDGDVVLETVEEVTISPNSEYGLKKASEKKEEVSAEEEVVEEEVEEVQDEKPAEEEVKKEEKPEKVSATQKRINKITREKYDAQREAKQFKERLRKLEAKYAEVEFEKQKSDLANEKPNPEDFDSDDEYHEKLGRWAAKMEIHDSKVSESSKEDTPEEEPVDPVQQIIETGKETYPDFEELVLREDLKITPSMVEAAADSEYASDIFYHLGQHPELATKIAGMRSPAQVAREIGRIENKFIADEVPEIYTQTPEDDSETIAEPKTKKIKKVSSAPPPVKPLGGSGKTATSLEEMTIAEYQEARGYTRDGMKKRSV